MAIIIYDDVYSTLYKWVSVTVLLFLVVNIVIIVLLLFH